jgi:hypothetical protein
VEEGWASGGAETDDKWQKCARGPLEVVDFWCREIRIQGESSGSRNVLNNSFAFCGSQRKCCMVV